MEAKTYEELLDRQRAIAAKIEDGSSEELERERVALKNAKVAAEKELERIEEKYQDVCKRMETKQAEAKELIEEFKTLDIELRRRRREKFEDLQREEQEAEERRRKISQMENGQDAELLSKVCLVEAKKLAKTTLTEATGHLSAEALIAKADSEEAITQFCQCIHLAQLAVDSFKAGDKKCNHLDAVEVEKVQKAIAEKQDWFNRMYADVSKMVSFSFVI